MSVWKDRIVGYGKEAPDQLLANPFNQRIHPKVQQQALRGSLHTLGVIQTVIVNKATNHIVDGHLRVTIALRENQPLIPVTYVELTQEEEAQALLSLDPIAALAKTDRNKLDELLQQVHSEDEDVLQFLGGLAKANGVEWREPRMKDAAPKVDKAEELQRKWKVERGQIWILGEHRIMCGDATLRQDVDRLMQGEAADLVFTDPPYGVSYVGENNPNGKKWDMLEGDDLRGEKLQAMLEKAFRQMDRVTNRNAALYCWHASSTQREYENALNACGFEVKQQLIWNKGMVLGHSDYHWAHEPLFYCTKVGGKTPWYGDRAHKTVLGERRSVFENMNKESLVRLLTVLQSGSTAWEIDRDAVIDYKHSTQKPVGLAERAIQNSSKESEVVVDFFAGSGSTLIACENLRRKCRAMEIKPKWVAVVLERWSEVTGKKPKKVA